MHLVTASEMRNIDRQTVESFGIPGSVLMENAGRGAVEVLFKTFGDISDKKVGIIAGKGNNGGDGFVVARYLAERKIEVTVYLLADSESIEGDAASNLKLLTSMDVPVIEMQGQSLSLAYKTSMFYHDIWIDAILGTGLNSEVKDYYREVIELINQFNKPILSIDIPSGLNSDNGQPCGISIKAHTTVTFAFPKIGHLVYPGASYTGNLWVVDIGIPSNITKNCALSNHLLTDEYIRGFFNPRQPESHKGTTGHLLAVAGSRGKSGAAAMVGLAAMRTGAGLVTVCVPECLAGIVDTLSVETMTQTLPETKEGALSEKAFETILSLCYGKKCMVIGPGIGTQSCTQKLVNSLIEHSPIPLVIDADGLNCIVNDVQILKKLKGPAILTPHPGEMARLMGTKVQKIQENRIDFSRCFAKEFNVHLVLKGARTVIAHPDGHVFINPTGNPGMASGGMGDALTGIIAGLITQGHKPEIAAQAGVYVHGAVSDRISKTIGTYGFLASDVIKEIPSEIKRLSNNKLKIKSVLNLTNLILRREES